MQPARDVDLSARRRLVARTTAGALIAGLSAHLLASVLWHGSPPKPPWLTIAASLFGAAIGAAGRRASHLSVPLALVAVAAGASGIVFDYHAERFEPYDFGVLGFVVVGDPEFRAPQNLRVDVGLYNTRLRLTGCGSTVVTIELRGGGVRGRPPSASGERLARVLIQRPSGARVSVRDDGRVVEETDDQLSFGYTVIETPLSSDARNAVVIHVSMTIAGLATPRTVGSCYVPLPALTAASTRWMPRFAPVRDAARNVAARGQVTVDYRNGGSVVSDATRPAPTSVESWSSTWACDDTRTGPDPRVPRTCHGVAVVEAEWRRPFEQLMLIVIGAVVALTAEYMILLARGRRP